MTYHDDLRLQRLAELVAMGSERIRAELELICQVGWIELDHGGHIK